MGGNDAENAGHRGQCRRRRGRGRGCNALSRRRLEPRERQLLRLQVGDHDAARVHGSGRINEEAAGDHARRFLVRRQRFHPSSAPLHRRAGKANVDRGVDCSAARADLNIRHPRLAPAGGIRHPRHRPHPCGHELPELIGIHRATPSPSAWPPRHARHRRDHNPCGSTPTAIWARLWPQGGTSARAADHAPVRAQPGRAAVSVLLTVGSCLACPTRVGCGPLRRDPRPIDLAAAGY